MRITRRTLAIAAAVVGAAVSVYLTVLHYQGSVPACPVASHVNCEAVLSSAYGVIAGTSIPTSAAGIVWFAVSGLLWLLVPFGRLHLAWSVIGMATVLYLVYVEIVALGAICLWCTASHVLVLFIFLLALTLWNERAEAFE